MKIAAVTFANNGYLNLIKRQETEFKRFCDCDYFHYSSFEDINSPTHEEHPYAFKPYAIKKVKDLGYSHILWADSPVYPLKKLENTLSILNKNKILLLDNVGWSIASYTNDKCLELLSISKTEAEENKMVMACFMAFDFSNETTNKIFDKYFYHATSGAYKGEWSNHRHDQSVMSILAVKYNINLTHPKGVLCYANEKDHDLWRGTEELTSNRTA